MEGYIYRVEIKIGYHEVIFDFPGAVGALEFMHSAKANYKALGDKEERFKVVMVLLDSGNVQDATAIRGGC